MFLHDRLEQMPVNVSGIDIKILLENEGRI
nr:MAG TPA: hypothetical protein [Caudoviricetes sp.]